MNEIRRLSGRPRPDDADLRVAFHVRRLRLAEGTTLKTLALVLGISPQAVHRAERGAFRLSAVQAYQCAELFGVSVDALFAPIEAGPTEQLPAAPPAPTLHLDALLEDFRAMDPKRRQVIADLVRRVASRAGRPATDEPPKSAGAGGE